MSLNFIFSAEDRNMSSTVSSIAAGVQDATRQIEANGGDINRVISMIKNGVATLGIGLGFKELVGKIASTRDEFQKLEITFNTLLGSEEKANALMSQLIKTAAITPFSMSSVTEGAKGLLAYGVAAEDVNETLTGLGDIAAGLKIPLTDLTYLYGTTITQGRMFTQDLLQFQGRGIPIADEIATILGITKKKVGDAVTAGKVTSEVFIQAMKKMYGEGSKFGGLMEAQSKSLGGQWENIQDSIEQMFNEIGKSTEGIMNTTLAATSAIVENWQSVLMILGDVAAAYGAQKAFAMLDSGFTAAKANYGYDAEIAQLEALLPVREQATATDLEQAEASGLLTKAKAEQIAALREEANVQLQALAAKEAAAKAEEAAALKKAEAAEKELADCEEMVKTYAEKLEAITQVGNAEEIEAALTELETAEALRNEAANLSLAASEQARAAATNTAAASEARETLATQINTAHTASNTAATGILTIAKEKLALAIAKVNAVLKANQFAVVTGAVIALGYAIYKLMTYQTEEQKIAQSAKEASDRLANSYDTEIAKLDNLRKELAYTKKGTKEWKEIKDSIVSQYGKYNSKLDEEIEKTGTLSKSYDGLAESIRKTMLARAMDKYDQDNDIDFSDVQKKVSEGLEGHFYKWVNTGRKDEYMRPVLEKKTIALTEESIRSMRKRVAAYMSGADMELTKREKDYLSQIDRNILTGSNALKDIEAKRRGILAKKEGGKQIAIDFGYTEKEAERLWLTRGGEPKTDTPTSEERGGAEIDKEIKQKKEELEKVKVGTAEWKKLDAEIQALEKERLEYGDYDRDHKKKSGATTEQRLSKTAAEEQQLTDLLKRQAEERLRQQQDYEYELWQNRIDLMEEGEAKVIAQMQLNNAKELTVLNERQQQEIQAEIQRQKAVFDAREDVKASKDKKYAKRVFSAGDNDITEAAASLRELDRKIEETKERLAALPDAAVSATADTEEIRDAALLIDSLHDSLVNVTAEADTGRIEVLRKALSSLSDVDLSVYAETHPDEVERLGEAIASLKDTELSVDTEADTQKIEELHKALQSLNDVDITVFTDADASKIEEMREALASLHGVGLSVNTEANVSEIENAAGLLDTLKDKTLHIGTEFDADKAEEAKRLLASINDVRVSVQAEADIRDAEDAKALLDSISDVDATLYTDADLFALEKARALLASLTDKTVTVMTDFYPEKAEEARSLLSSIGDADVSVHAEADIKGAEDAKRLLDSISDIDVTLYTEADLSALQRARELLASLTDRAVAVNTDFDPAEAEQAKALLASIGDVRVSVLADADISGAEDARRLLDSLSDIEVTLRTEADIAAVEEARAILASISDREVNVSAKADTASVESLRAEIDALTAQKRNIEMSVGDVDLSPLTEILERSEALNKDLKAKQEKAEQDRLEAAKEAMNAYLREFGNYQQKRLAIQEEYDNKIKEAQNEGERMTLMAQRDKALSDLDYSEWVDSGEIALAFGDIAKLSDSTIERLISDMERYREKVIATFDPEKIREYEEALTKLRDVQAENSFGIFAEVVPDYLKQRQSVASQRASAGANLNALGDQRAALLARKTALEGAQATGGNMSKELQEVNAQLNANDEATKKAKNAFQQLQEQWDQLDSPEAKFYGICEAVAQTASMVGGLTDSLSGMLDAMGAGGLASAVGTLGEAMGSVQNIASGFAKGGLVGGITAAAGEVMGWVGKLFAAGDKKHQKNIERLQEQIDTLQKSYDKLGKAADEAFSTDASELIDQQNTLLQQQKVLIKQQIAEEEAKKKTDKEKVKQWKEQLEEIDETLEDNKKKAKEAIVGEDIKSAISEFAEAYASAWEDGTDAASKSMAAVKNILKSALTELMKKTLQPKVQEFYDLVAKYAEGGFTEYELNALDVIKRQIDAASQSLEEQFKTIEDRYKDLDELKEELTDISFDSVRDSFKSQLLDMEADASDFTESFTDMLRSAVIEGLMDNKYDAMLKEWYDEFARAMDDQTLSDEERDSLRQRYESIINEGIADRNAVNEIIGGGSYSQTASQGRWESMGQDTADELNGRFTALTELQVINNDLQQTQNTLSAQILATLQGMSLISGGENGTDPTLLAIKDMMFLSTGYLEDIRKYTKILTSVDERLATLNTTIDRKL